MRVRYGGGKLRRITLKRYGVFRWCVTAVRYDSALQWWYITVVRYADTYVCAQCRLNQRARRARAQGPEPQGAPKHQPMRYFFL